MTDRFVLVPASYVYLLREGDAGTEVLLQLRQGTPYMDGHWAAAAAGHVERGETAYDAARREALEELGVTDVSLDLVFTMQRTQHGEAIDERVDWFFTARSWTGTPRVVEPDKAAADRVVPALRAAGADGAARGVRPRAPVVRRRLPDLRVLSPVAGLAPPLGGGQPVTRRGTI